MPCSPTSASLLLPNHRLQTVTCFKTSTGSAHARLLPVLQISPVPFPTVIFLWMFGSLEESILSFDQIHPYSANCYWMNLNSVTTFLYLHLDNYPLKVKVKKNPTVMGKYLYALEGLHIHWCNLLENTLVMSVDILKKCTYLVTPTPEIRDVNKDLATRTFTEVFYDNKRVDTIFMRKKRGDYLENDMDIYRNAMPPLKGMLWNYKF